MPSVPFSTILNLNALKIFRVTFKLINDAFYPRLSLQPFQGLLNVCNGMFDASSARRKSSLNESLSLFVELANKVCRIDVCDIG